MSDDGLDRLRESRDRLKREVREHQTAAGALPKGPAREAVLAKLGTTTDQLRLVNRMIKNRAERAWIERADADHLFARLFMFVVKDAVSKEKYAELIEKTHERWNREIGVTQEEYS